MVHQDFASELVKEIPRLRRFARGLVSDAALADDLVQDCVERALVKQHLYDTARPLRAWLFAILRNIHVSQWRRNQHFGVMADVDGLEADEPAVAPAQEQNLSVTLITDALDLLPQPQREVLILISLEEMSYKEAAEIMGVPIGTVMSRLSRARSNLQDLLEKRGTTVLRVVK
ncbi:sigma-70 family RNA polymerase sigma factor [Aestuariivirga litoralis]|uniref:sigma-70 family RNA polymerase sigma factor n=1 Tax=Aestuariivirga litoralis TaxID=2650924 RepID=UPI0018C5E472|nr:sigma-70 family RNA polymerase sigma factor [Aestuariivirga litoralis]MBG1232100.1 sigma-70 family RNA polymerase sigma factor [Aestuariivirga litoralis]